MSRRDDPKLPNKGFHYVDIIFRIKLRAHEIRPLLQWLLTKEDSVCSAKFQNSAPEPPSHLLSGPSWDFPVPAHSISGNSVLLPSGLCISLYFTGLFFPFQLVQFLSHPISLFLFPFSSLVKGRGVHSLWQLV